MSYLICIVICIHTSYYEQCCAVTTKDINKIHNMQDTSIDVWCSKISKCIISVGDSIFHTLERGLRSKIKRVSRDCLIAISWLGCQISKNPDSLSNSASEIILRGIEQFLHPGVELDERLLACMCMYNYASGKGIVLVIFFFYEACPYLSYVT
jgi:hypothetical protein